MKLISPSLQHHIENNDNPLDNNRHAETRGTDDWQPQLGDPGYNEYWGYSGYDE